MRPNKSVKMIAGLVLAVALLAPCGFALAKDAPATPEKKVESPQTPAVEHQPGHDMSASGQQPHPAGHDPAAPGAHDQPGHDMSGPGQPQPSAPKQ